VTRLFRLWAMRTRAWGKRMAPMAMPFPNASLVPGRCFYMRVIRNGMNSLSKRKKIIEELDVAKYGGPFTVVLYNRTLIGWQEKEMDFYLDTNSKYVWGSSIQPSAPDVKGKMSVIKLPMRDLCKDIMDNYRPSDYVIVKMDIEGTEFHLVRSMLVRGVMPYIDELFVEFHRFAGADGNDDGHAFANIFINEYVPIAKEELHMKFGSWS